MSTTFLVTSLVIVVTPGVGALFTLSEGLVHGARAGVVAAVGCTLGIVPHLAAAVTGTAALLQASGVAFEIVKVLGVAYLLYLAVVTWRDRSELVLERTSSRRSARRVIVSAVLANLLNPKLTIFFFAFLPQFVPPHGDHQLVTMLLLSGVFMLMTLVVFALFGICAGSLREHVVTRPRIVRRMRRAFAASFVALGAKLAVTSRV
jgi:threonine/homoserine/homoserine lactone efflux protein